jgi:hypothetical protein
VAIKLEVGSGELTIPCDFVFLLFCILGDSLFFKLFFFQQEKQNILTKATAFFGGCIKKLLFF